MQHDDELKPEGGWAEAAEPRLQPEPPEDRGVWFRGVSSLARMTGRKDVPAMFSVLHASPRLFWPWLWFASRLTLSRTLPATDRERVILRTAWNCRSRYVWGQHVALGLSVGLTDAAILLLSQAASESADPWTRALLRACDEQVQERCIASPTWTALQAQCDAPALLELTLLIGHYQMIAGVLNSAGLPLDPPQEEILRQFNDRVRPRLAAADGRDPSL